ncbi:MAG: hypothetical protein M3Z31_10020 [Pseudomonadota bacterium]|nr:hypothetical protein [Pseudomonadota bacterium]
MPAQPFVVRVWHAQMEIPEDSTRVPADLSTARKIDLAWTLKLKPEMRVRRAPVGAHGGHY